MAYPMIIHENAHKVGRKWYVRILILGVVTTPAYPEGIKYRATLVDLETGERVLAIDNCAGHGDHIHIRNELRPYHYLGTGELLRDFWKMADTLMGEDE